MGRKRKIIAVICALALAVNIFGAYTDNAGAASLPVTSDDATLSQEVMKRGTARNADAKAEVQQLLSGKKVQGRLVSGDDGQQYEITLKSSGQLDICLEGDEGKLSGRITDKDGKGWVPQRRTADGKQTYQLKKGTYYYQLQAAKGAKIPETGLDYAITATFKSAKAKYENNNTRGKAVTPLLERRFYGHLASNAPEEYYKFTLKRVSCLSFRIDILDIRPETYEVTLYNKNGTPLSRWETGWEEEVDWDDFWGDEDDDWYIDDDALLYDIGPGLHKVLLAGTYYIGVSIKKDKDGKIPASAQYGQYRVYTSVSGLGLTLKLPYKQAAYTGKKITLPKPSIRRYPEDDIEVSKYETDEEIAKSFVGWIWNMTTNEREYSYSVKNIGRYRIGLYEGKMDQIPTYYDAYAIFTVTPIRGKINRVRSKKQGQIEVSVKKNVQSTGYQIQIARDKKFKKSKRTLNITNIRKTIKGLSSGKKYYVRIRNYKNVKTYYCSEMTVPETIYGKWSGTKTVVCK